MCIVFFAKLDYVLNMGDRSFIVNVTMLFQTAILDIGIQIK